MGGPPGRRSKRDRLATRGPEAAALAGPRRLCLRYDRVVDPNAIRAFVRRDWAGIDDAKTAYWKEQKQARSAAELLAMGADLFAYARGLRPDWPGAEDRAEDLAVHLRVSEALRAVRTVAG
jgi:hypothetical protein